MVKHPKAFLSFTTLSFVLLILICSCGGPHSSPESIARAWVEAKVANDWDRLMLYIAPDSRSDVEQLCPDNWPVDLYLSYADVEDVVVREWLFGIQRVTLVGDFRISRDVPLDTYEILVEKINGKWYVTW